MKKNLTTIKQSNTYINVSAFLRSL